MSITRGMSAWRSRRNHNRMIEFARDPEDGGRDEGGPVKLAFFGSSAFRVTSPRGLSVMIDPWRNLPTDKWDWYFHDFPMTEVDVGVSTHAHFDHDALECLDANVLLDRPIGTWRFADVAVHGVPDKHAIDPSSATYDFKLINSYFGGQPMEPPDNSRNWDNTIVTVETGGLRICHWGDNRHNAPDAVFEALGRVDILLMPVDDSQHVMGNAMVAEVIARVAPSVVVPHHYYTWNIVQRGSTLLPVTAWLAEQGEVREIGAAETSYAPQNLPGNVRVDCFGDHVAFDVDAWHRANGLALA